MIILQSNRLRVEVAEPGECPNNTWRFDRSGFISEVVLDGFMSFCASEPQNLQHPSSGGRGFCSEYRMDVSADAEPGTYYPKLGIGLIKAEKGCGYIFHRRYQDVKEFPVSISSDGKEAVFIIDPIPCMGYAMRIQKRVSVLENKIRMEIKVENVGEKVIDAIEYCHNFISIDGMAIGPDYRLSFPGLPDQGMERKENIDGKPSSFCGRGKAFSFCEYSQQSSLISVDVSKASKELPFVWRLENNGAKAFVEGEESFIPAGIEIWAVDHLVSPEVFYALHIQPGGSQSWQRVWKFDRM